MTGYNLLYASSTNKQVSFIRQPIVEASVYVNCGYPFVVLVAIVKSVLETSAPYPTNIFEF